MIVMDFDVVTKRYRVGWKGDGPEGDVVLAVVPCEHWHEFIRAIVAHSNEVGAERREASNASIPRSTTQA